MRAIYTTSKSISTFEKNIASELSPVSTARIFHQPILSPPTLEADNSVKVSKRKLAFEQAPDWVTGQKRLWRAELVDLLRSPNFLHPRMEPVHKLEETDLTRPQTSTKRWLGSNQKQDESIASELIPVSTARIFHLSILSALTLEANNSFKISNRELALQGEKDNGERSFLTCFNRRIFFTLAWRLFTS